MTVVGPGRCDRRDRRHDLLLLLLLHGPFLRHRRGHDHDRHLGLLHDYLHEPLW